MGDKDPVVQVAAERAEEADRIVTLSTDVRARLHAVGASLVDDAVSLVKDPQVPMFHNEDKGRDEPNPLDPDYLREVAQANRRRATAAMDAMIMFGIELVDGLPEDDKWLQKLQFLERRGQIDLDGFDLEQTLDREFLFKKYVATGTQDLIAVGRMAGLRPEDVAEATKNFPG